MLSVRQKYKENIKLLQNPERLEQGFVFEMLMLVFLPGPLESFFTFFFYKRKKACLTLHLDTCSTEPMAAT